MADFRFDPFTHEYDEVTLVEIHQVEQHGDQGGFYGFRLTESILRESPSSLEVRKITSSDFDINDVPDTIPVDDFDDNDDYSGTDYTEVTKSVTLGSTNFKADYSNLNEADDSLTVVSGQYDTAFVSVPSGDNDEYFIVKYKGLGEINIENNIESVFYQTNYYTSSTTITVPDDAQYMRITLRGGGQAGFGIAGSYTFVGSKGGNSASIVIFAMEIPNSLTTMAFVQGAGGAGAANSQVPAGGGDSTLTIGSTTYIARGAESTNAHVTPTGAIVYEGELGTYGLSGSFPYSGAGGGFLAGGERAVSTGGVNGYNARAGSGAGGGGAAKKNDSVAYKGGNGGSGSCLVEWWGFK